MLTDDDLTRELGAAFRAATEDLTYAGRTRPPRTLAVVLPSVATAATLAAVAVGVSVSDGHHPAAKPGVASPIATSTAGTTTRLVTKTLKLEGFTVKYQSVPGDQPPVYAVLGIDSVPANAHEIQLTGTDVRGWVGTYPPTGENAVYVKAPTRNDGSLFALVSPSWTQDQLVGLLTQDSQVAAVPAVSAGSGDSSQG